MAFGQAIFRDSRRRRVLQDEARRAGECPPPPATEGARYTEAANVENHPQVTQFIPRRYRSYALGLMLAAVVVAAIGALHVWADELARAIQTDSIRAFDLAEGGGLAAWFGSLLLAGLAVVAWLVYTLRRHRVDDYKARYRLWLWVAGAGLLASMNCVADLHTVWASLWVHQTGWAALDSAVWWLAPVGVGGAWMAVRLVFETAECRGACSFVLVSTGAYVTAALSAMGVLPHVAGPIEPLVTSTLLLVGHAAALAAVMLYARYVVLDVQGLIPHAPEGREATEPKATEARSTMNPAAASTSDESAPATLPLEPRTMRRRDKSRQVAATAKHVETPDNAWVDGSTPEGENECPDNDPQRGGKPNKADRKRLRKQRRQCA